MAVTKYNFYSLTNIKETTGGFRKYLRHQFERFKFQNAPNLNFSIEIFRYIGNDGPIKAYAKL